MTLKRKRSAHKGAGACHTLSHNGQARRTPILPTEHVSAAARHRAPTTAALAFAARRRRRPAADPLIRTKLYRPELTGDHVSRGRLLKLMDRSLSVPLTVVSAPAGYGKSTLVSEWLAQQMRSAWLSLDATESELAPFLEPLAAVETIAAGACEPRARCSGRPSCRPRRRWPRTSSTTSIGSTEPFFWCSTITTRCGARRRCTLVEAMLDYAPRALHLVLITRNDLPWSLTGLRAEAASASLRFASCASRPPRQRVPRRRGLRNRKQLVGKLDAQIEGWPVGWRLLLQALRRPSGQAAVLDELTAGSRTSRRICSAKCWSGRRRSA